MSDGFKSTLRLLNIVKLPTFREKPTSQCLEGMPYKPGRRDANINSYLPRVQCAFKPVTVGIFASTRNIKQTLAQMFAEPLMLASDTSVAEISRLLKAGRHVLGLQQVDELIFREEKFLAGEQGSEEIGLRTDGLASLIPVINESDEVEILYVCYGPQGWSRELKELDHVSTWAFESLLVLGNPENLNL